jgi:hypothetical protein
MTPDEMSSAVVICCARRAATRNLLHDFSNVMVGLCSMSENVLDDVAPGNPLRDDMEIIRDSALRARQIIRLISVLNGSDEDDGAMLVDLVNWFTNEADTIKGVLPKGSVLKLPDQARTVLANVASSLLRDYLITFAACTKNVAPHRVNMEIGLRESDDGCEVVATAACADDSGGSLPCSDETIRALDGIAKKMNAAFVFKKEADGSIRAGVTLRPDKTA